MKLLALIGLITTLFFMTGCSKKNNTYYKNNGYKETYPVIYDYVPLTPVQNREEIKSSKYYINNL